MSEQVEVLERSTAIPQNIDPTGRKWVIKYVRGSSLSKAQPEPYMRGFSCPPIFRGMWTSRVKLQEQITLWLGRSWDESDLAAIKAQRAVEAKAEAAAVQAAKTKKKAEGQAVVKARQERKKDAKVQDNKECGGADGGVSEPVSSKPTRAAKGKGANKTTSRKVTSKGKKGKENVDAKDTEELVSAQ